MRSVICSAGGRRFAALVDEDVVRPLHAIDELGAGIWILKVRLGDRSR
jgi:hypothetical protein